MPKRKSKTVNGKKEEDWKTLEEEPIDDSKEPIEKAAIVEKPTGERMLCIGKYVNNRSRPIKSFWTSIPNMSKVVEAISRLAVKLGFPASKLSTNVQMGVMAEKMTSIQRMLTTVSQQKEELQNELTLKQQKLEELEQEVAKNNLPAFNKDIAAFEKLLSASTTKEPDIQRFLEGHTWFFGLEYTSAKPKKLAGSPNELDFYLQSYKNQGVIVELKPSSEPVFRKDYEPSARLAEAFGQLIRYMEATIAISHSTEQSRTEGIAELKPWGYIVIGRNRDKDDFEKIKRVNSYLHRIEIVTYDDLLLKAKQVISKFQSKS